MKEKENSEKVVTGEESARDNNRRRTSKMMAFASVVAFACMNLKKLKQLGIDDYCEVIYDELSFHALCSATILLPVSKFQARNQRFDARGVCFKNAFEFGVAFGVAWCGINIS